MLSSRSGYINIYSVRRDIVANQDQNRHVCYCLALEIIPKDFLLDIVFSINLIIN